MKLTRIALLLLPANTALCHLDGGRGSRRSPTRPLGDLDLRKLPEGKERAVQGGRRDRARLRGGGSSYAFDVDTKARSMTEMLGSLIKGAALERVYDLSKSTTQVATPGRMRRRLSASISKATSHEEHGEQKKMSLLRSNGKATKIKKKGGPLKVLFLSADTGGGHRASAEALAKLFEIYYPGTTYSLLDVWTTDGCFPYRTLVSSYTHLSAHPFQWALFYHLTNNPINKAVSGFHSRITCEKRIRRTIESYNPDVVISIHPTMNLVPRVATRKLSEEKGKHIPFFTVVTDYGSGHCTWFYKGVDKMYLASKRIELLAKRRWGVADETIVRSGLPIRHQFWVQSDKLLGDRRSEKGKQHQRKVRKALGLDLDSKMVLVVGGGEGVGHLSQIVDALYLTFAEEGIDATIAVVCGRNQKLKEDLETRDWNHVLKKRTPPWRRQSTSGRSLKVVPLGFVANMAEYMVASDVLISKAGPGMIAEAAAVGLPVMLTSFLPGQEAGNVKIVLDGYFGDYCSKPRRVAKEVSCWLKDDPLLDFMSRSAMEAGAPQAASDIVLDIGETTHQWMKLNIQTQKNTSS